MLSLPDWAYRPSVLLLFAFVILRASKRAQHGPNKAMFWWITALVSALAALMAMAWWWALPAIENATGAERLAAFGARLAAIMMTMAMIVIALGSTVVTAMVNRHHRQALGWTWAAGLTALGMIAIHQFLGCVEWYTVAMYATWHMDDTIRFPSVTYSTLGVLAGLAGFWAVRSWFKQREAAKAATN